MKIFFTAVLSFLILIFVVVAGKELYDVYIEDKPKVKREEKKEEIQKISLVMVGDALIHKSVYMDAKTDDNNYDFRYIFEYIEPIIKTHDLAFYNQETIIGGKQLGFSSYPRFNTPEEFADAMVEIGFNVVSLANNHSLDKGENGIINSINYWKNKNVLTAGTYLSIEDKENKEIKEKNGISYTLLAYTTNTNGLHVPDGKEYLVNVFNYEKAKDDIIRLRDKVDLLLVSMHWGDEYTNEPNKQQKQIAHFLASLNVDIIIGHHPHVIQPIEYIEGTLVFYSLGNFLSAQIGVDRLTGMICSLDISKITNEGQVKINFSDINVNLIYTYYRDWKDFKIIPFDMITYEQLGNYEYIYEKYSSIVTSLEDSVKVANLNE